jgi:hypothetical protein
VSAVFTPLGPIFGLAGGQLAKKRFDVLWGAVDGEEAPRPKHREVRHVKLIAALLAEGAVTRAVRGMIDHGARHGWLRMTGAWPGEERPEEER